MSKPSRVLRVLIKSHQERLFVAPQLALILSASGPTGDLCSPHPHAAALEGTEVSPLTGKEWLHRRLCHRSLAETKTGGLVVPGQQRFTAWTQSLSCPPHHSFNASEITISPGSISTDRSATSSSSSDKGPWLADRPENSFQLQREEEV